MPAGILRRLINFQVANPTRDAAGQLVSGGPGTWRRLHRKVPAGFVEVSGGEGPRGTQIEATATALFKIRFLRAVTEAMQIELIDGHDDKGVARYRYFSIVSVLDRDGREEWLEIQATEIKQASLSVAEGE